MVPSGGNDPAQLNWAWKTLSDQWSALPALGWAPRGWEEQTDGASALGTQALTRETSPTIMRDCDSL